MLQALIPSDMLALNGFQSNITISSAQTKIALIFAAQETGNAEKVAFNIASVSSSQSLTVGIQELNSSTKHPTGTWLGATNSAYGTIASPAAGLQEVTLGEVAALTRGVPYAVVIEFTSTAGNITIHFASNVAAVVWPVRTVDFRFGMRQYTTTWGGLNIATPVVSVLMASGNSHLPGATPAYSTLTTNSGFNSGSTPDEYGNKIVLPDCVVNGLFVVSDIRATCDLVLYDNADNEIASREITAADVANLANGPYHFRLASEVEIAAGTYRVTLRPQTTTNSTRSLVTFTSGLAGARSLGTDCCLTSRTDLGAWTDDANSQMLIGVIVKEFTGGGGGNSGGDLDLHYYMPPDMVYMEGGLVTTVILNATTTKLAQGFMSPATDTASAVFVKIVGVTTPHPLRIGLQAIDMAGTKKPTGVWLGETNNGFAVVNPTANTITEVTLGEPVALTRGQIYAIVVEWESVAGNITVGVQQSAGVSPPSTGIGTSTRFTYASGAWSNPNISGNMVLAIKLTNTAWWHGPQTVIPGIGTTPAVRTDQTIAAGNKMQLPDCVISALWATSSYNGSVRIAVLDEDNNEIVTTESFNEANDLFIGNYFLIKKPINPTALSAGIYRVVLIAETTTASSLYVSEYLESQNDARSMPNGACAYTSKTAGGEWVDEPLKQMSIGVVVKKFTGGGGGGGGYYNPFRNPLFGG